MTQSWDRTFKRIFMEIGCYCIHCFCAMSTWWIGKSGFLKYNQPSDNLGEWSHQLAKKKTVSTAPIESDLLLKSSPFARFASRLRGRIVGQPLTGVSVVNEMLANFIMLIYKCIGGNSRSFSEWWVWCGWIANVFALLVAKIGDRGKEAHGSLRIIGCWSGRRVRKQKIWREVPNTV